MTGFKEALERRKAAVEKALREYLSVESHERLYKAMSHYPLAGGKRLRPVLTMVVADAVSGSGGRTLPFGCALELIHNFTLVHDDIMDNDDMRRGIVTVHRAFDIPTAIIAGDALFSLAFEVVSRSEVDEGVLRTLFRETAETVRIIAEGQQLDMEFETRSQVSEGEYMDMIGKKTASLFRLASMGGALIAGGSADQVEKASQYGRDLGTGFQIKDDILGILGEESVTGKPVGSDVRNGKKTLIAIKGFELLSGKEREKFKAIYGNQGAEEEEIKEAIALLDKCGAIRYAQEKAAERSRMAKRALEVFGPSEHRAWLEELADYVVSRDV